MGYGAKANGRAMLGAANPVDVFLGPRETQLQKWGRKNNQNALLMP